MAVASPEHPPQTGPAGSPPFFTDREAQLRIFREILAAPEGVALRVQAFHAVGGGGKTSLIDRFCAELDQQAPPVPHARFDVENVQSPAAAAREALLRLRSDLERRAHLEFDRFDRLFSVLIAAEGGPPPSLVNLNPGLKATFDFVMGLVGIPTDVLGEVGGHLAGKTRTTEKLLAKAGGRDDVLTLRDRARRADPTLADELIDRFADDLDTSLPKRSGRACRCVLFFDTFETLWKGSDTGRSVQARRLDAWLRQLARAVLAKGVLVVVAGRDELRWADDDPEWQGQIDHHHLPGLPRRDARIYLARRDIGTASWDAETLLQQAILDTCADAPGSEGEPGCLPFSLALCADIVENHRARHEGADPAPEVFLGIPSADLAARLADRFLKSLPDERWELWIRELSLTPSFDEQAALALDRERHHNLGRVGWKQLLRYSFIEPQPEGFVRIHKTMRDVLRTTLDPADTTAVHTWFRDHWTARAESALAFFHHWSLDPAAVLDTFWKQHGAAVRDRRMSDARRSFADWSEILLDGHDRLRLGDALWARTHLTLGIVLGSTPNTPPTPFLDAAIAHYESALQVYTEANFPVDWAMTQHNLATAYSCLPTGDQTENLRRAIACFEAALRVHSESRSPDAWAMAQVGLGTTYSKIPTGNRSENLRRAIACFEAALRVHTEEGNPGAWALAQNNLGTAYLDLPTGNRGENLRRALAHFESVLRVHTETAFPTLWAMAQNNLGMVYHDLPTGDRAENLGRAVACFEAALRVWTESDHPADWARTQVNLGAVCRLLPDDDQGENFRRALDHFESALRVITETDYPADWARTQMNLGNAHASLATGDRAENHRRAIACYEAALRVYTEQDFPEDWAQVQSNLGRLYRFAPTGDREENLRRAIAASEAALRVYTEQDFPDDWARVQTNLGLATRFLPSGNREENMRRACDHFFAALRVDPSGLSRSSAQTRIALAETLAFLGEYEASLAVLEEAERAFERLGETARTLAQTRIALAEKLAFLGEYEASLALLEEAERALERLDDTRRAQSVRYMMREIRRRRDQPNLD